MRSCAVYLLAVFALCDSAEAQSLKLPTVLFACALTADLVTTYQVLDAGGHERNPTINRWQSEPVKMITISAVATTLSVYAWNRWIGKRHPRIAAVGLYVAAGVEAYFAFRNYQQLSKP